MKPARLLRPITVVRPPYQTPDHSLPRHYKYNRPSQATQATAIEAAAPSLWPLHTINARIGEQLAHRQHRIRRNAARRRDDNVDTDIDSLNFALRKHLNPNNKKTMVNAKWPNNFIHASNIHAHSFESRIVSNAWKTAIYSRIKLKNVAMQRVRSLDDVVKQRMCIHEIRERFSPLLTADDYASLIRKSSRLHQTQLAYSLYDEASARLIPFSTDERFDLIDTILRRISDERTDIDDVALSVWHDRLNRVAAETMSQPNLAASSSTRTRRLLVLLAQHTSHSELISQIFGACYVKTNSEKIFADVELLNAVFNAFLRDGHAELLVSHYTAILVRTHPKKPLQLAVRRTLDNKRRSSVQEEQSEVMTFCRLISSAALQLRQSELMLNWLQRLTLTVITDTTVINNVISSIAYADTSDIITRAFTFIQQQRRRCTNEANRELFDLSSYECLIAVINHHYLCLHRARLAPAQQLSPNADKPQLSREKSIQLSSVLLRHMNYAFDSDTNNSRSAIPSSSTDLELYQSAMQSLLHVTSAKIEHSPLTLLFSVVDTLLAAHAHADAIMLMMHIESSLSVPERLRCMNTQHIIRLAAVIQVIDRNVINNGHITSLIATTPFVTVPQLAPFVVPTPKSVEQFALLMHNRVLLTDAFPVRFGDGESGKSRRRIVIDLTSPLHAQMTENNPEWIRAIAYMTLRSVWMINQAAADNKERVAFDVEVIVLPDHERLQSTLATAFADIRPSKFLDMIAEVDIGRDYSQSTKQT